MTEASPAEQPVEAEKKKRLFHRIPTSLLVTVIGIALTAWLLPAITRQWDDRQKAHDLQAGLVADIASATGHALVTANRADTLRPNHAIVGQQAATAWLLASIPLEARLRAYFPSEVVAAWNVYAYFVDRFVGVSKAQAYTTLGQPIRWMMGLPTSVGPIDDAQPARRHFPHVIALDSALEVVFERKVFPNEDIHDFVLLLRDFSQQTLTNAEKAVVADRESAPVSMGFFSFAIWGADLLRFEEDVAALVLASHPTGYSTTTHDLIHDLIP